MTYDEFIEALETAGWNDTGDAQHTGARLLWRRIFPGADPAAAATQDPGPQIVAWDDPRGGWVLDKSDAK